jgi:hypothetical protein
LPTFIVLLPPKLKPVLQKLILLITILIKCFGVNAQLTHKGFVLKTAPLSNVNADANVSFSTEAFIPSTNKSITLHTSYIYKGLNYGLPIEADAKNVGYIIGLDYKSYYHQDLFWTIGTAYKYFAHTEQLKHGVPPLPYYMNNFEKKRATLYGSIGGQFERNRFIFEFQTGVGAYYKQYFINNESVKKVPRVHDSKRVFFFEDYSGAGFYFFLSYRFGYRLF